jgi:hypothetical protein
VTGCKRSKKHQVDKRWDGKVEDCEVNKIEDWESNVGTKRIFSSRAKRSECEGSLVGRQAL